MVWLFVNKITPGDTMKSPVCFYGLLEEKHLVGRTTAELMTHHTHTLRSLHTSLNLSFSLFFSLHSLSFPRAITVQYKQYVSVWPPCPSGARLTDSISQIPSDTPPFSSIYSSGSSTPLLIAFFNQSVVSLVPSGYYLAIL